MEELHRHPLQAWSSQTNSQDTPRFSSILQVLPKPFYQLFRRVSTSPRPSCAAKLHLLVLGPRLPKEKPPDCWSLPPRPFKTTISSPQFSHFLSDALSKVSTVILANVGPKGDPRGPCPKPSPQFLPILPALLPLTVGSVLSAAGSLLGTNSSTMGLAWGLSVLFLLHVCGSNRIPGKSI